MLLVFLSFLLKVSAFNTIPLNKNVAICLRLLQLSSIYSI